MLRRLRLRPPSRILVGHDRPVRLLHLSHHPGCFADIDYVGRSLGIEVTNLQFDDGYNIGSERADRAWERHREAIVAHDVVLTSDTAPLSRIVLQHLDEFPGRLVVWVCNRFDYAAPFPNEIGFPDPGYYRLVTSALDHPRVQVVPYTAFESVYARRRGIPMDDQVIKPIGERDGQEPEQSLIPEQVARPRTFFIPQYHNDTVFVDLEARCRSLGLEVYRGRYAGPADLRGFRGVIHIPYAWSNLALFENAQNGLPHVVPSLDFIQALMREPDFFWPDLSVLNWRGRLVYRVLGRNEPTGRVSDLPLSEWYDRGNAPLFRYFDSWDELRGLGEPGGGLPSPDDVRSFAASHRQAMLRRWADVLGSTRQV